MEHLNSEREINWLNNSARRQVELLWQRRIRKVFFFHYWINNVQKVVTQWHGDKTWHCLIYPCVFRQTVFFLNSIGLKTSNTNIVLFIFSIQRSFKAYCHIRRIRWLQFQSWRLWLKRGLCGGGRFWSLLYLNEVRFLVLFLIIGLALHFHQLPTHKVDKMTADVWRLGMYYKRRCDFLFFMC